MNRRTEYEDVGLPLAPGALLVEAVGDGGGGGLVDDAEHVEAGDGARVLGGLALGVVEVGGHGHHGGVHLLAEEGLSGLLHLGEDHGGHLLGGEDLLLATGNRHRHERLGVLVDDLVRDELGIALHLLVRELAADEALHVVDGALGVGGGLVLGGVADEALGVGEGDVGRGDAVALVVGDNLNAAVLVDAHARVGGAKIDTDDSAQALLGGLLLGAGARHEGEHGHGRKHEAVHPAEAGLYKRGMARCKSDETPLSSP
mmetsp:Transcript_26717/g.85792  ORF Transcript_26717/g.85792 Transcript_26717/m.85792 type:complete len:258 (+) Transcript_26717:1574-2347(+)